MKEADLDRVYEIYEELREAISALVKQRLSKESPVFRLAVEELLQEQFRF